MRKPQLTRKESTLVREDVRHLRAVEDPAERAREATELLRDYQATVTELSRIRREAFEDLQRRGFTQTQVARAVGLSRGRIGQLAGAGPAPERALLGDDDLTVLVAQKREEGRRRPVIAAETVAAFSRLQTLAQTFGLSAHMTPVPPPGLADLNRDNLVVLGGARVFPLVGQLLEADPYLRFRVDSDGHWCLHDAQTAKDYGSPHDGNEDRDYAYLGRVARPDGKGTFLVAAGIHPIGTQGAVALLETELAELYATARDRRFSLIVECTFDPDKPEVHTAKRASPIYRHDN